VCGKCLQKWGEKGGKDVPVLANCLLRFDDGKTFSIILKNKCENCGILHMQNTQTIDRVINTDAH